MSDDLEISCSNAELGFGAGRATGRTGDCGAARSGGSLAAGMLSLLSIPSRGGIRRSIGAIARRQVQAALPPLIYRFWPTAMAEEHSVSRQPVLLLGSETCR